MYNIELISVDSQRLLSGIPRHWPSMCPRPDLCGALPGHSEAGGLHEVKATQIQAGLDWDGLVYNSGLLLFQTLHGTGDSQSQHRGVHQFLCDEALLLHRLSQGFETTQTGRRLQATRGDERRQTEGF